MKFLGKYIKKREDFFGKSAKTNQDLKFILDAFFKEKFNIDGEFIYTQTHYDPKENSLTIVSSNKVIANELAIQLADLCEFLKKENIKLNNIYIK